MTDRLDNLILLAEKGMSLRRVHSIEDLHAAGQHAFWVHSSPLCQGEIVLSLNLRSWDPYTSFTNAGMLTRALGIDLIADVLAGENIVGWEATDSDGRSNVSGRGDGNTKAAQCQAIVETAILIVKAKR